MICIPKKSTTDNKKADGRPLFYYPLFVVSDSETGKCKIKKIISCHGKRQLAQKGRSEWKKTHAAEFYKLFLRVSLCQ